MKNRNRFFPVVGIIVGVVSIAFGIVMLNMNSGVNTGYEWYGGDAYTGIQQAGADAAANVKRLTEVVKLGFGLLFMSSGIGLLSVSGYRLKKGNDEVKNNLEYLALLKDIKLILEQTNEQIGKPEQTGTLKAPESNDTSDTYSDVS